MKKFLATGEGLPHLRDRKLQRALLQFFKPENYFEVRQALLAAWRSDLIGSGCDCLVPAHPPRKAIEARRRQANGATDGDHYHTVANPAKGEPAASAACPIRATDRVGRRRDVTTRSVKRTAAVVDRAVTSGFRTLRATPVRSLTA